MWGTSVGGRARLAIVNTHLHLRFGREHTIKVFSSNQHPPMPSTSHRIQQTDAPCIVKTKALVSSVPGTMSLAQGIVHWGPPPTARQRAIDHVSDPDVDGYGPDEGLPALREALRAKVANENGLLDCDVMVTAGANQAFTNVVVALLDAEDSVVLFKPYYFNHQMAIQMTGGSSSIEYGPCNSSNFHPDLDWLESRLAAPSPPKMVVIVNPCNPSGVLLSKAEIQRASAACAKSGTWLVLDNTYEHFVYDGGEHYCLAEPHVINIFSFSKAFGMMGWRIGYIAYNQTETALASALLKVQDTVPICPPQLSQYVALGALEEGRQWVKGKIHELESNRVSVLDALSPLGKLGEGIAGGEGAIYFFAKLPEGCEDDDAVVEWLVRKHKVCLIPGSSCGCPGYVRAAFANLPPEKCSEVAGRLKTGLAELVSEGMPAVYAFLNASRTSN